ncbi:class F sortase [Dactylosporangium aurantiacum]|nr:class F sortase [Dactylosporangium aurantiacum]MDG6101687.1 class F sortase [Dactylosporangium aurantiacum]
MTTLAARVRDRVVAAQPRQRRRALDVLTAVCAVAGLAFVVIGAAPAERPQRRDDAPLAAGQRAATDEPLGPPAPAPAVRVAGTTATTAPTGATGATGPPAAVGMGASVPVHLEIPAIGVSTALMELGLNGDGTIAVPPLRADAPAGWYRHLATPGEVGPAVILGHVDTARDGPAVFYQLRDLRPGDEVSVRRADGSTAVFGVDRVAQYPKAQFPSAEVYGAADRPVLRLVTCGGTFDRLQRSYRGNVVVFATLLRTA